MEESAGYQIIFEEGEKKGELKHARKSLLRKAAARFGGPDAATEAAIATITEVDRLDRLADNLLNVSSWSELLAIP